MASTSAPDPLISPDAVHLIMQNRNRINCMKHLVKHSTQKELKDLNEEVQKRFDESKFMKDESSPIDPMEPISIKEMALDVERYYAKKVLQCMIIDEPCFGYTTDVVLQDQHGSICLGMFSDFFNAPRMDEKFGYGREVRIRNPYFNGYTVCVLRREDVSFLCERSVKRCRVCGVINAFCRPMCTRSCKMHYCSERCCLFDMENMEHRMVCSETNVLTVPESDI